MLKLSLLLIFLSGCSTLKGLVINMFPDSRPEVTPLEVIQLVKYKNSCAIQVLRTNEKGKIINTKIEKAFCKEYESEFLKCYAPDSHAEIEAYLEYLHERQ